ncbi:hypothetical protein P3T43_006906 [Paraburkholderia sp. GAS41]
MATRRKSDLSVKVIRCSPCVAVPLIRKGPRQNVSLCLVRSALIGLQLTLYPAHQNPPHKQTPQAGRGQKRKPNVARCRPDKAFHVWRQPAYQSARRWLRSFPDEVSSLQEVFSEVTLPNPCAPRFSVWSKDRVTSGTELKTSPENRRISNFDVGWARSGYWLARIFGCANVLVPLVSGQRAARTFPDGPPVSGPADYVHV